MEALGDEPLEGGHPVSASESYLRASNYWRTAVGSGPVLSGVSMHRPNPPEATGSARHNALALLIYELIGPKARALGCRTQAFDRLLRTRNGNF